MKISQYTDGYLVRVRKKMNYISGKMIRNKTNEIILPCF